MKRLALNWHNFINIFTENTPKRGFPKAQQNSSATKHSRPRLKREWQWNSFKKSSLMERERVRERMRVRSFPRSADGISYQPHLLPPSSLFRSLFENLQRKSLFNIIFNRTISCQEWRDLKANNSTLSDQRLGTYVDLPIEYKKSRVQSLIEWRIVNKTNTFTIYTTVRKIKLGALFYIEENQQYQSDFLIRNKSLSRIVTTYSHL